MQITGTFEGVAVKKTALPHRISRSRKCVTTPARYSRATWFVAIRGYATDGHKYIAKAMEQGAAAVVCEEAPEGVPAVVVENSRIALAEIAANRFGHPAESMVMLGVTGTNGKTTTTYLVKHMLEDAGAQGRPDRHQPEPHR